MTENSFNYSVVQFDKLSVFIRNINRPMQIVGIYNVCLQLNCSDPLIILEHIRVWGLASVCKLFWERSGNSVVRTTATNLAKIFFEKFSMRWGLQECSIMWHIVYGALYLLYHCVSWFSIFIGVVANLRKCYLSLWVRFSSW